MANKLIQHAGTVSIAKNVESQLIRDLDVNNSSKILYTIFIFYPAVTNYHPSCILMINRLLLAWIAS